MGTFPGKAGAQTNLMILIFYHNYILIYLIFQKKDFFVYSKLVKNCNHMGWFKELDFFYIKIILLNKYKLPVI